MRRFVQLQRFGSAMLAITVGALLGTSCGTVSTATSSTGGSSTGGTGGTNSTFSISGTVSGLTGTLVLQNNAGDDVSLTEDGAFTFATELDDAAAYAVTVLTQPTGQTCTVADGSGTVSAADVTAVTVTCTTDSDSTFAISGTTSGLSGTVVLQNNAGDNLTVSADGTFAFTTEIADGGAYAVTVLTQPTTQTCTVGSGSGTVSGAIVTSVTLTCVDTFTVGGTVTGLGSGKTLVLQNNGGDDLTITADGAFTFSTRVASGTNDTVSILTQPSGQTCTGGGSGVITGNEAGVPITCTNNSHKIFVTSGANDGNLGGVTTADSACASAATSLGETGTYKALLVDGSTRIACTTADCSGGTSEHTAWVLAASTPYIRQADSVAIGTTSTAGIFTFSLSNAFSGTLTGFDAGAWTGLETNWTGSSSTCSSWGSSSGSGAIGNVSATSNVTLNVGLTQLCSTTRHLICVEQ